MTDSPLPSRVVDACRAQAERDLEFDAAISTISDPALQAEAHALREAVFAPPSTGSRRFDKFGFLIVGKGRAGCQRLLEFESAVRRLADANRLSMQEARAEVRRACTRDDDPIVVAGRMANQAALSAGMGLGPSHLAGRMAASAVKRMADEEEAVARLMCVTRLSSEQARQAIERWKKPGEDFVAAGDRLAEEAAHGLRREPTPEEFGSPAWVRERAHLANQATPNPFVVGTTSVVIVPARVDVKPGDHVWMIPDERQAIGRANRGILAIDPGAGPSTIGVTFVRHDKFVVKRGLSQDVAAATIETLTAMFPVRCPTCMGAKVLRHIDPAYPDEPCPDCPPEIVQGPSEWTLSTNELYDVHKDDNVERRRVKFVRHTQTIEFTIAAFGGGPPYRTCAYHHGSRALVIEGECCAEMILARLLCALRDGEIK